LGVADYGYDFWVGAFCKRPLLPGSRTDKSAPAIGDSCLYSATPYFAGAAELTEVARLHLWVADNDGQQQKWDKVELIDPRNGKIAVLE
jgi:hypothetical protein